MTASIDTAVRLVKQAILQVSQISESGSFFIMILWGLLCSFITTETDKYRYLVPAYRYLLEMRVRVAQEESRLKCVMGCGLQTKRAKNASDSPNIRLT